MITAAELPAGVTRGGRWDDWRPTPPRYLVADVDGTLLGEHGSPTDAVLAALDRAAEAGLRVGFATGRMRAAVEPLWRATGLPGPHVLHNGALVRSEGRTLASWPLEPGEVEAIVRRCVEHGWYAELYVADGYLVTDRRPEAAVHWHMLHQPPAGTVEDLDPDDEVLKVTVAVFDEPPDEVVEDLSTLGLRTGAATSPQAPGVAFVNVTRPDVDKGRALRIAAEHVGVPLSSVIAVGDGANDLPMLAVAGTAIAMGQSEEEVRAAAHLVVPTVREDGVARAVEAAIGWATGDDPANARADAAG